MSDLTRLHEAVREDRVHAVSDLVLQGADLNAVYRQETAFTRALEERHYACADVLLSAANFRPNAANQFGRSPLFMAAKQGRADYVEKLLSMRAEVNEPDIRGVTPLGACAWYDSHESAELLLRHGANTDQADVLGQTPLFRACSNVSVRVVAVLLAHDCDVNLPSSERRTPLMAALPSKYNSQVAGKKISDMLSICQMLVDAGCDVNAQDGQGKTALHHAVEADDLYGLCFLADNGADLTLKDNSGYTAFHSAILPQRPRYELARYLLYLGADGGAWFLNPVEAGCPVTWPLHLLLQMRPRGVEEEDVRWSRTLLLRALAAAVYPARTGFLHTSKAGEELSVHEQAERDVAEWLNRTTPCTLRHQARLTVRATLAGPRFLPRLAALGLGHDLQRYVSLGVDTGRGVNEEGWSLGRAVRLHCHIEDGDNQQVRRLLDAGADVNLSLRHKTALALALRCGNEEASRVILGSGRVTRGVVGGDGDTLLHVAARHGRDSVLRDVIAVCRDLDAKNARGVTPLQEAVQAGHFVTAASLLESGAALSATCPNSLPMIHLAAGSGDARVVELMLHRGVDPNVKDKYGNTPLHLAASKGEEYVKRLVAMPALYNHDALTAALDSVHVMLSAGNPILTCPRGGHLAVVKILLAAGADITMVNSDRRTPAMCAQLVKADSNIMGLLGQEEEEEK